MRVIVLGGTGAYGQIVSRRLTQSELVSSLVVVGRTIDTTNAFCLDPWVKSFGCPD